MGNKCFLATGTFRQTVHKRSAFLYIQRIVSVNLAVYLYLASYQKKQECCRPQEIYVYCFFEGL